jgi:hypothetical protein
VVRNQYLTLTGFENIDYDFLIYNDRNTVPNNIKIIRNVPTDKQALKNLLENKETYEYETSNIKFILAEIIYEGETYKIDLSTKKVNFYLNDNIFSYSFFLYYLRYYHDDRQIFFDIDKPIEFTLKLIDQNVNSFYTDYNDDTDGILIQKDDYIIENLKK